MSGVNKVIIIGNLGNDPEMRATNTGSQVATISVATSETWKDKQTGQKQEQTEWHRIVAFNRLAEIIGQYLSKGSKVYIEGRLQTRKWIDDNKVERYTTEIIANNMQMLDSASGGNQNNQRQAQPARQQQQNQATQKPADEFENFDDDIPF